MQRSRTAYRLPLSVTPKGRYRRDTVQLETVVSTISQEYLLEFTPEYGISEDLHPELSSPEEMIMDFLKGKVGVYTKFFEIANFRLLLSQFLFDILGHCQIYLSQLVFSTVANWRISAPKDEMPAKDTYSAKAVTILNTHSTPIQKQPEALLCLVGLSWRYFLGDDVYPTFLHDDDRGGLIRASNPINVKTSTHPRVAHEVLLLTVTASRVIEMEDPAIATDSSGVPSTIERSPLEFSNENPSQQSTGGNRTEDQGQEIVAPESTVGGKSLAAILLGMGSTFPVATSHETPVDRIQARENEIKNLEALLEAETDMKKTVEAKNVELGKELENLHALWVIGHGLRLAVMKCGESTELRQVFTDVVSAGIAKGMSEGLKYRVEHRKANLDLEAIEAYDPEAETKYVTALHALRDLKYLMVDQLELLKDAPIDVVMESLHLESDSGEDAPQWIREFRPSSSQLKIPMYPEVRNPKDPWAFKEEILLADAIAANVSRAEKKKKCRVVCRTHGVNFVHHAGSDGVIVSVPTVTSQGLAILLADAATQTKTSEDGASLRLLRSNSLPFMHNLD
nr:transposase (putative), gypsy type [Tanacetum cinerariifolium]